MSINDNLKIARSIYDAFNSRNFDAALKHVDKNVEILNVPLNTTFKGTDGYKQFMQGWATAFPDSKCEVTNVIAGEDYAVVEFRGIGTHKGVLKSPEGDIQATGKHLELPFCDVHKIQNGKIVQSRSYFDMASMMKQLGLVPELHKHY